MPLMDGFHRNIMMIIISLMHILRQYKSREIRENGLTTPEGFIRWNDIKAYNWTEYGDELRKEQGKKGKEWPKYDGVEFIVNRDGLFSNKEVKIEWKAKSEQKKEVEELLSSHINIDNQH